MRTNNQHSMIYELTFPVSTWIQRAAVALLHLPHTIQVEHQRKQFLKRKFADMTDPTFLDRALAGEEDA